MSELDLPSVEVSAENFKYLMLKMKIESDPIKRLALSKSLSETLLQLNGFNAYFDYISSNTEDNIECMNLFCKVVLTRPSLFCHDTEYLMNARTNFSDIIERFLRNDDDQSLQIFVTKFFYFLRRNQNENAFDIIFDSLLSKSEEMHLKMLKKLCSWKFYIEELSEIYFKQYKRSFRNFLNNQTPSNLMAETIRSISCILNFESLYAVLSEHDCVQIKTFLALWIDSEIPIHCVESAIAASFPENDIILFLSDKFDKMTIVDEKCKAILREKSKFTEFDAMIWNSFIDTESDRLDFNSKIILSRPGYNEIFSNIDSDSPTDIAFGMYCLRNKIATEIPNLKIDKNLLDSILSRLFHEESFVYMNCIKTCVCIGEIETSSICDALLKTAKSRINIENILILVRFVEIFDSLLHHFENNTSLSPWTELFSSYCAKFISSDCFELKCSIINYYINIIAYDYNAFLKNQKELWDAFNLRSRFPSLSDLETEALFRLIDSYVNLIDSKGRNFDEEDSILLELHDFLRRSLSSTSTSILTMAYHNILNLEKIRSYK